MRGCLRAPVSATVSARLTDLFNCSGSHYVGLRIRPCCRASLDWRTFTSSPGKRRNAPAKLVDETVVADRGALAQHRGAPNGRQGGRSRRDRDDSALPDHSKPEEAKVIARPARSWRRCSRNNAVVCHCLWFGAT